MTDATSSPGRGRDRQIGIFIPGLAGQRPSVPVCIRELERRARARLSPEADAYVAGGAGAERTMAANRAAFDRWRIVPRMLRDVTRRDLTVELFGARLPTPLLLAPIGVLELVHPQADLAVARAAAQRGVPMVFSNQASHAMEACAGVMGDAPRWFQLYWSESDELVRSFVARAERCGCQAIVLTLDTTMLGWRPRDLDLAYLPFLRGMGIAQYTSDPTFRDALRQTETRRTSPRPSINLKTLLAIRQQFRNYPGAFLAKLKSGAPRAAVQRFIATYSRPSLTWSDLHTLRALTELPILLKGILHPDDARAAVEAGMNGIVVSNHGGRQVDGAIGALDALPPIVEAVAGRLPILLDSGVRSGADVFKAIALGATAVLIGRPYVYGLALDGERGVGEVIDNVLAELDLTMGLAGCRSVREIADGRLARSSPNSSDGAEAGRPSRAFS